MNRVASAAGKRLRLAVIGHVAILVLHASIVVMLTLHLSGLHTRMTSAAFLFFAALALITAAVLGWQQRVLRQKLIVGRDSYKQLLAFSPIIVFEIDENLRLQGAVSDSFEVFFYGKNFLPGTDFSALISFVSDMNLRAAGCAHARALFADEKGEHEVTKNPLEHVTALLLNEAGKPEDHHFSIQFSRRFNSGKISRIFVAVCDVSELTRSNSALVTQSGKLETESQETLKLLVNLLSFDRGYLVNKLQSFEHVLDQANLQLKHSGQERDDFLALINLVLPQIYSLRKSAENLNLTALKLDSAALINELEGLSQKPELAGNDFFRVALKLDELYDGLRKLNKLVALLPAAIALAIDDVDTKEKSAPSDTAIVSRERVADPSTAPSSPASAPKTPNSGPGFDLALIQQACVRTAEKLGKKVRLQWQDLSAETVPNHFKPSVIELIVPLVRNALSYAIELPAERVAAGKSETATVVVRWAAVADGYELLFRDDGRGLSLPAIRSRALALQRALPGNIETLGLRELAGFIFQPGFSTAANGNDPLGFGFGGGLDVLAAVATRVGAKVSVGMQAGVYTQFRIRFANSASNPE